VRLPKNLSENVSVYRETSRLYFLKTTIEALVSEDITDRDTETDDSSSKAAPTPFELPAGYRIQEYVIAKTIGTGGFGITYLGRDTNLDKKVAIKEYFPFSLALRDADQTVNPRTTTATDIKQYKWGLDRFIDEARTLAQFEHKNLIRVIRYIEENKTAYIIMEFAEGLPLSVYLKEKGPFNGPQMEAILFPLLDGLEVVHQAGTLHRDIKPENIIIRPGGDPVLIDFGAARQAIGAHSQQISAIITPGYAPYEQYSTQGKNQGPWTDIYALGAVAYSCLTGKTPIEASERNYEDELIPAEKDAKGHASPALLQAIDWSMRVHFRDRPQSVKLWRDALQDGHIPVSPHQEGDKTVLLSAGPSSSPSTYAPRPSRKFPTSTLIGSAILIFSGAIGFSFWQSGNESSTVRNIPVTSDTARKETPANVPAQMVPKVEAPKTKENQPTRQVPARRQETKPNVDPALAKKLAQEEKDFQTARYIHIPEAYEIFLRLHPNGKNSPMARRLMAQAQSRRAR
tara:strand:- start:1457 stop:2998 length:1542 start_codon:yes stop_codon:yes gene_type:complete